MERGVFRGSLEEQQCAVFQQVLDGKTSREIAQILQISTKDVERIVRKTCQQLGVTNRKDAARAMAAHYRWNTKHCVDRASPRSDPGRLHPAQRNDVSCINDAGSFNATHSHQTVKAKQLSDLFGLESSGWASSSFRRVLLLTILVLGSSLALSALISAMQGFETLVSSWS